MTTTDPTTPADMDAADSADDLAGVDRVFAAYRCAWCGTSWQAGFTTEPELVE